MYQLNCCRFRPLFLELLKADAAKLTCLKSAAEFYATNPQVRVFIALPQSLHCGHTPSLRPRPPASHAGGGQNAEDADSGQHGCDRVAGHTPNRFALHKASTLSFDWWELYILMVGVHHVF